MTQLSDGNCIYSIGTEKIITLQSLIVYKQNLKWTPTWKLCQLWYHDLHCVHFARVKSCFFGLRRLTRKKLTSYGASMWWTSFNFSFSGLFTTASRSCRYRPTTITSFNMKAIYRKLVILSSSANKITFAGVAQKKAFGPNISAPSSAWQTNRL